MRVFKVHFVSDLKNKYRIPIPKNRGKNVKNKLKTGGKRAKK